jgi:hypothetical protein
MSLGTVSMMARAWVTAMALTLAPVAAFGAPSLALPIRCEIGSTCIVQNHVDRAPGPDARDFRCGRLTYDGHKGTDFRVIGADPLARRTAVLAAAPGRVRAVRDGMPDVSVRVRGAAMVAGREAGNSVIIDHGEDWVTQYAHLRNGSVAVRPGDMVQAGQQLGFVGLSGHTEFPHLHFEVRHRGAPIDPHVGLEAGRSCEPGDRPLWRDDVIAALGYRATGLLEAGLAGAAPVLTDAAIDHAKTAAFGASSPAVVFWVQIFGARANDVERFRLVGPDGRTLAERRAAITRDHAQWLAYVGKRGGDGPWPAGRYRGEYALYRDGGEDPILAVVREIELRPPVVR